MKDTVNYHRRKTGWAKEESGLIFEEVSPDELDELLRVSDEKDAEEFVRSHAPMRDRAKYLFSEFDDLPDDRRAEIVAEVLDTVELMRAAVALAEHAPEAENGGSRPDGLAVYHEDWSELAVQSLHLPPEGFYTAHYTYSPRSAVGASFGEQVDEDSYRVSTRMYGEVPVVTTPQEAVTVVVDRILTEGVSGVKIIFSGGRIAFSVNSYASFLWMTLAFKLTDNEMRTCRACGRPFVANMGNKHERGHNPKEVCDDACRALRCKARKAVKLMAAGDETAQAAKAAGLSVKKLERFIDLNAAEVETIMRAGARAGEGA